MATELTPENSGIVAAHIAAIKRVVAAKNVFLFVRPTEDDSRALIELNLATKSVDIHDKSSNWGPMAGLVPCDPYFSKAPGKVFEPNPAPELHKHGDAQPIHLTLSQDWIDMLVRRRKITLAGGLPPQMASRLPQSQATAATGSTRAPQGLPWPAGDVQGASAQAQDSAAAIRRITCSRKVIEQGFPQEENFLIDPDGKVYWCAASSGGDTKKVAVWVWAYGTGSDLRPVTGDYDLWMVVAHGSNWKRHVISTGRSDTHGTLTASDFTVELMVALNNACAVAAQGTQQVFNHGAEAQNYAFTQKLDFKLAMFTPGGRAQLIDSSEAPELLAYLAYKGYLVIMNKRYDEADPHLSGQSQMAGQRSIWLAHVINRNNEALKMAFEARMRARTAGTAWGVVRAAKSTGIEVARISLFGFRFRAALNAASPARPGFIADLQDFPSTHRDYEEEERVLVRRVSQAAVEATEGKGTTNEETFWDRLRLITSSPTKEEVRKRFFAAVQALHAKHETLIDSAHLKLFIEAAIEAAQRQDADGEERLWEKVRLQYSPSKEEVILQLQRLEQPAARQTAQRSGSATRVAVTSATAAASSGPHGMKSPHHWDEESDEEADGERSSTGVGPDDVIVEEIP